MNHEEVISSLPCWHGKIDMQPLGGGITNINYVVTDSKGKHVVRLGDDIPVHQVMRFNELAASRAAHAAGISPEVTYWQPGALVLEFIDGKTLTPEDIRDPGMLNRIVPLIRSCHRNLPRFLRGPSLVFWVFHVIRDYAHSLADGNSRSLDRIPRLLTIAETLESTVGPVDMVYGHNDLLAGNFIDDGDRLWLIDWDYAGFNSPLFDLGGLCSNNELDANQEQLVLERYFEKPANESLQTAYRAMKCASLLRETLWSMVSEIHSELDFDYHAYSEENLSRFEEAVKELETFNTRPVRNPS